MQFPDVDTLRLCSILASSAFGLVFTTLWLRNRSEGHFAMWGLSSLLYGGAILAFWMTAPGSSATVTALYALLGLTNVLPVVGANMLDGKRPLAGWMAIPILGSALGHGLPVVAADLGWVLPNGSLQTLGDALGLSLSMGLCGLMLGFERGASQSAGRRMAGLAMLGYLPAYFLSIIVTILALPGAEWVALLAMLSDQVLLGVLNLGLLSIPVEHVQRQLRDAALRDPLTGTWNRGGLDHIAPGFAATGAAAIAIDVDHFKSINDRFGHAAGDDVLVAVGREAREMASACAGQAARLGGDEFVVLLPPAGDAQAFAAVLLERLRTVGETQFGWSVSMGIGEVLAGESSLIHAIRRADMSLYEAKARGRARIAA
jgi:diguanylate cyclase (GGDEF)-like protein